MHYLILKMCANNVSVSSSRYICIALIFPSTQLCRKRTYCSSHIKRSCIRSRLFCGTNWASEGTTWDTQAIPPHPHPPFVSDPLSGVQEDGVGRGGAAVGHLLSPGPRPHSLTALTLHICQLPSDISDRSPFYREHAPVGALDTERPARL